MAQRRVERVGFVGLGIMGRPMAENLVRAGFRLLVHNRSPEKCRPLREIGAEVADSPAEVARGSEVVCLNLPDTPDVEAVLFGPGGVAEGSRAGLVAVDHSTISPAATREFAARLAKREVALVDAPVSGGDAGARAGTLSVMAGGPAEAFERVKPLLQAVGKSIVHLGPAGSGQTCKACNQIAVSVNLLGVCEALALAKQSGLDLENMIGVLSGGAAGSWQLANLGPKIAAGDFAPGFMIDLVLKDLRIVRETAEALGLALEGAALAASRFRAAADSRPGVGRLGTQAMALAFGDALVAPRARERA